MNYKDEHSGIEFPLEHPFAVALEKTCERAKTAEQAWIADLRTRGVKMAHPDDGWVNREKDEVTPVYPYFDLGADIGDLIVLGWPGGYRVVKVIGRRTSMFGQQYLRFQEMIPPC